MHPNIDVAVLLDSDLCSQRSGAENQSRVQQEAGFFGVQDLLLDETVSQLPSVHGDGYHGRSRQTASGEGFDGGNREYGLVSQRLRRTRRKPERFIRR